MTSLRELHLSEGATLADDGIPLRYSDGAREHGAFLHTVIMDRSHEGRIQLGGRDRLTLPDRISTNAVGSLTPGGATPTLFLTPNARIIDRVTIAASADSALMLTEPGRAPNVTQYLRRNIFYNDEMTVTDVTAASRQFVLIGHDAVKLLPEEIRTLPRLSAVETTIDGVGCVVLHDKPFSPHPPYDDEVWRVIVPSAAPDYAEAARVWSALRAAGKTAGARHQPVGSLAYFGWRVSAGRLGVNAELSGEYIPLEVGLWDEISFSKGCYTGQEIIARMDSRRKLARTIVRVKLDGIIPTTPAPVLLDGREVGRITSAVEIPGIDRRGIAVVKLAAAHAGVTLTYDGGTATVIDRAGVQPETTEDS